MSSQPKGTMSVPDAQKALAISRQRLYQLIAMGRVPSIKTDDGRVWIPITAVEKRVAGNRRLGSNQCITTREVADFFGVDHRTVRDWFTQGRLKASKINNRLCFAPADVIAFVPPTEGSAGRNPARTPTRTLRGRVYPPTNMKGTTANGRSQEVEDGGGA